MASSLKNNQAYTNPQRVIQKKFDVMIDSGKAMLDGVASTLAQSKEKVAKEREYQKKQNEIMAANQTEMYGKINNIGTSGNKALDNNIQDFWYNKVDDYYKIKNAMDQGVISKNEGAKQLSSINGLLGKFKQDVSILSSNANAYRQDLEAGNVSNLGSPESKEVLGELSQNGNVHIVERGGELYYFKPGDDVDGVYTGDAIVNGGELRAMEGRGESLYKTKVNVDPLLTSAFDKTYQPGEVAGPGYIKTITKTRNDWMDEEDHSKGKYVTIPEGQQYTFQIIDEKGKTDGQAKMMESGVLDPIVNNPSYMESYWEDSVPDEWLEDPANGFAEVAGTAWGFKPKDMSDEEFQKIQTMQSDAAKKYLAEQAYSQNAAMDQKMKFMSKGAIPEPPSGDTNTETDDKGVQLSQENRLVYNTRRNDYDNIVETTETLYASGTPTAEDYTNALNIANPGGQYYVNKKGLIQSGKTIINIPEDKAGGLRHLNERGGIDREMQVLFSREKKEDKPGSEETTKEKTVEDYLLGQ